MPKKLIVFILFASMIYVNRAFADAYSEGLLFPAEISGKIFDKDGKFFTDSVTVVITANIVKDAAEIDYTGDHYKHVDYKQVITGSVCLERKSLRY